MNSFLTELLFNRGCFISLALLSLEVSLFGTRKKQRDNVLLCILNSEVKETVKKHASPLRASTSNLIERGELLMITVFEKGNSSW